MNSIRQATPADLHAILEVEQSWPEESRAGADKFLSRMQKFPQGFLVGCIPGPAGREIMVATVSSMPLHYDPGAVHAFESWDQVTNDGYLRDGIDLSCCNALYIVSGVIDERYRGAISVTAGIKAEVALAVSMGLRYVVAGAVIPGFLKYSRQHGDISAFDYCTARRGKRLVDPLLAMYETIGFRVPDARHVIQDYYPDEASRDYAALVVRDLHEAPLEGYSGKLADEFLKLAVGATRNGFQKTKPDAE